MTVSQCETVCPPRRRVVAGILMLAGAILAFTLIHSWNERGRIPPLRITEASMAPTFCGDHLLAKCPHCQTQFAVDAQSQPPDRPLVCAQCRHGLSVATDSEFRRGQRVWIQTPSAANRGPRRWDVWALRHPHDPDRLLIKRIIGLPEERVSLRAGDVYINGCVLRKTLAELRQLAIVVTEDRLASDAHVETRRQICWQPESRSSGWRLTAAGLEYTRARDGPSASHRCDWLNHSPNGTATRFLICDDYAYNQTLSRRLNPVSDLLLQCDFSVSPVSELAFRAQAKDATWVLSWRVGQRSLELHKDGQLMAQQVHGLETPTAVCRVEFGLCDRQILFGLDGRQCISFPCPEPAARVVSEDESTRLAVGAVSGRSLILRLRVVRDVYYERPQGPRAWPLPVTLAANEFFLLGDNSPRSIDSRYRALGPVAREWLVGAVRPLVKGQEN
jgi:predicted Zn finger-like uncharacterized protein